MIPKANILTLAVLFIAAQLSLSRATGASTHAIFDLSRPAGAPFPSNAFTVVAPENITGLRVNLALPDFRYRWSYLSSRSPDVIRKIEDSIYPGSVPVD